MDNLSSEKVTGRRPDVFRALGPADPPASVTIGGMPCDLAAVLKYDSWAATAVYVGGGGARFACKFNRSHPLPAGIPAAWIGRALAGREERVLRMMHGEPGFPRWAGEVEVDGVAWPHAVSHHWIEGEPFHPFESRVGDGFFPELQVMLSALHAKGIAYVDMSKWGNILVGADGHPYLLDYQIHWQGGPGRLSRTVLRWLQAGDVYYLRRHWRRCRPDQVPSTEAGDWSKEPPHIWLAERLGPFFRGLRLATLRAHGVKGDPRKTAGGGA